MNHFFIYIDVKYFKGVFMNMFCKIGITSAICAAALFTGCSDDSSNPTDAGQAQVQTEAGENEPDPGNDDNEDYSSSSFALPESSETTVPESAESTEPTSTESSDTPTSESSGTTPESAETTTPSSTASALTPLQEYEQAQDFIDEGWRDECLRLANEYRATEGVAPLELADDEKQLCAINQAAADMADNKAHGHFKECGEWAQNSGPNFPTSWRTSATAAVQYYIKMMWEDEKALVTSGQRDPDKKEDYSYIGHYLNMRKASYTKVACGIAISEDGTKGWFNMNFY